MNKIATLRNARGQDYPNLVRVSRDLIEFGAPGITVHPRPDERHITRQDVYDLKKMISDLPSPVEFNIEGYPSDDFTQLIEDIRPDQVTLVPDPPDVLTSNAGWQLEQNKDFLKSVLQTLNQACPRVSLFVDAHSWNESERQALKDIAPQRVEIYTESFAKAFHAGSADRVLETYRILVDQVIELGIELNAGHDLNLQNLGALISAIPQIKEVSIGHALVTESLYQGFQTVIEGYNRILGKA